MAHETGLSREVRDTASVFTLPLSGAVSLGRLSELQKTLEGEARELEEANRNHHAEDKEELVQTLNLLTWIEFKLGSRGRAFELSDRVHGLTNRTSVFSLGNRVHLNWRRGDLVQTRACLAELAQLLDKETGRLRASVAACQAYCLWRLGGRANLSQAINLYRDALEVVPTSDLWRFQLGVACRRMTAPDMLLKSEDHILRDARKREAKECLYHVATHSSNLRLKAFACSDLALMARYTKGANRELRDMCERALKLARTDPYVLLTCGKSLMYADTRKALELLEEAATMSPKSHAYTQLANCLRQAARKEPRRQEDCLRRAEECYLEAVRLDPSNVAARYKFAQFLKSRGKVNEAVSEFMQIISTGDSKGMILSYMKTYEQAGLCLLELCDDPAYVANLPTSQSISSLKKDAEAMLIKALDIGIILLSQEDIRKYLGGPLDSLLTIAESKDTPDALLLLSRVYRIAREPEQSLEVLRRLLDNDETGDPNVLTVTLETCLDFGRYEEALAVLDVSTARHGLPDIAPQLSLKVPLLAAKDRMMRRRAEAAPILRALFHRHKNQRHGHRQASAHLTAADDDVSECDDLDVLILYDGSREDAGAMSPVASHCKTLQMALSTVLGLTVTHNLQGCPTAGPQAQLQRHEMTRAEVVLVLLDSEPLDNYFESLLHFLPSIVVAGEENLSPRVLTAYTEATRELPSPLLNFPSLHVGPTLASLETFEQRLLETDTKGYGPHQAAPAEEISRCVDDILSLFSWLISTTYERVRPPSGSTCRGDQ